MSYVTFTQGWDVKRLYYGRHNKPDMDEEGVELVKDLDDFLKQCDVVSINLPLSEKTKYVFFVSLPSIVLLSLQLWLVPGSFYAVSVAAVWYNSGP